MQKENQLKSCCKNSLSSREVVARDLPHPMLLLNKEKPLCFTRKAEDPRTLRAARCTPPTSGMTSLFNNGNICPTLYSVQKHYGMTSVGRGFTLIELLVVVLIIGILAAVAVPQYQKAVMKSRYANLKNITQSIASAQKTYHLANGTYATDFDELAIDPGGRRHPTAANYRLFSWGLCNTGANYSQCQNDNMNMYFRIYNGDSATDCGTRPGLTIQNQICKQETGLSSPTTPMQTESWYRYP